jgi:hypothetical protein
VSPLKKILVLSLACLLVAAQYAGERLLEPSPPTTVTVAPAPSKSDPLRARSAFRFAWFYNAPADGTPVSEVARRAKDVILTGDNGADALRDLREAGYRGRVLNYVYAPACSDHPRAWWNQLCRGGEYASLPDSYFLHDGNGSRLRRPSVQGDGSSYWAWNPGDPGFRRWAIERLRWMLQTWGYDGIFLDEIWGYWHFVNSWGNQTKSIREYPTEAGLRAAWDGFIAEAKAELGVAVFGNTEVLEWHDRTLDGSMIEHFATGWSDKAPMSAQRIQDIWARLDATRKDAILVGRGERTDTGTMRFALAAYLMVARPGISFRYSDGMYEQLWWYPESEIALGRPLGPRENVGGDTFRRRFEGGTVTVDLVERRGVIPSR